jgi:hypothetical protein
MDRDSILHKRHDSCIRDVTKLIQSSESYKALTDDTVKKFYCTCFIKSPENFKQKSFIGIKSSGEFNKLSDTEIKFIEECSKSDKIITDEATNKMRTMLKLRQKIPEFNNIEYGPEIEANIVNKEVDNKAVDNTKLPPLTRATAAGTGFKRKYLKSTKSNKKSKRRSKKSNRRSTKSKRRSKKSKRRSKKSRGRSTNSKRRSTKSNKKSR